MKKYYIIFIFIFLSSFSSNNHPSSENRIEYILNVLNLFKINLSNFNEYKQNFFSFLTNKKDNELEFLLNSEVINYHHQNKKPWTILVYIAGDNDLFKYALRNIYQMMNVGSSSQINILIHFDFHARGKPKMTRRYYVMKDKLIQVGDIPAGDSGDPKNLINAANWAIKNYPSNYFGLILWDHGTGSVDPNGHTLKNIIKPESFFEYDPFNKIITLKKEINFLDALNSSQEPLSNDRGICFDETSKNYLNNHKIEYALRKISEALKKKIDILLFDACLMMGVEVAYLCHPFVHYLVGSEEVVLGPGYNYGLLFLPLLKTPLNPQDYAQYVVKSYAQTYSPISRDFTESALDLTDFNFFLAELTVLFKKLVHYLNSEQKNLIKKIIKMASGKDMVTHFAEPSYIDLKHFLDNIVFFLTQNKKNITTTLVEIDCINDICDQITKKILPLFNKIILANVNGSQSKKAQGMYIYYPHQRLILETGYNNVDFASISGWGALIKTLKNA